MKKNFFLFNQRFVYENELPENAKAEFEKLAVAQVDKVGVQKINKLIADINDEGVKTKAIEFITKSILGDEEGVGLSLKSFDAQGAKEESDIIQAPEFERYQQYLERAVAQIANGNIGKLEQKFSDNPETIRVAMDLVIYCPEIEGLFEKNIPLAVIQARAKLINKLKEAKKHTSREEHQHSIDELIDGLAKLDSPTLRQREADTFIEKFEGDSVNRAWTRDRVSFAELASRVTHDSELVSRAFGTVAPKSSSEINEGDRVKIERLRTFAASLEHAKNDAEYKTAFIGIHLNLNQGNVSKATDELQKLVDEFDESIKVGVIADSKEALAYALRKLGDTEGSGKQMREVAHEKIKDGDRYFQYAIEESMKKLTSEANDKAEQKYVQIMGSLSGTVEGAEFQRLDREEVMKGLVQAYLLEKSIDKFIKEEGAENVGPILAEYNDMKGLYGRLNWSDEREQMVKETAVMVASFIGTTLITGGLGAGAALTGLANVAAKIASGSRIARLAQLGKVATGLAKAGEVTTKGVAWAQGVKLGKFGVGRLAVDAVTFTAVQHGIEALDIPILAHEQTALQQSFMEKLKTNAEMFALFAGVGALSGKLITRFGLSEAKFVSIPGLAKLSLETSGDLGAMYILHGIETGKLSISSEEFVQMGITAIAFRVGMKSFEKMFPRLGRRIEANQELAELKIKKLETAEKKALDKITKFNEKHSSEDVAREPKLQKESDKLHKEWREVKGKLKALRESAAPAVEQPAAVEAAPATVKEAAETAKPAEDTPEMKALKAEIQEGERELEGLLERGARRGELRLNEQKLKELDESIGEAEKRLAGKREQLKTLQQQATATEASPAGAEPVAKAKYEAAQAELKDAGDALHLAQRESGYEPTNDGLRTKVDEANARWRTALEARDQAHHEYRLEKGKRVPAAVRTEYEAAHEAFKNAQRNTIEADKKLLSDHNAENLDAVNRAGEEYNTAERRYVEARKALDKAAPAAPAEAVPGSQAAEAATPSRRDIELLRLNVDGAKLDVKTVEAKLKILKPGSKTYKQVEKAVEAKREILREHEAKLKAAESAAEATPKTTETVAELSARLKLEKAQAEEALAKRKMESDPYSEESEIQYFKASEARFDAQHEYNLARAPQVSEAVRTEFNEAYQAHKEAAAEYFGGGTVGKDYSLMEKFIAAHSRYSNAERAFNREMYLKDVEKARSEFLDVKGKTEEVFQEKLKMHEKFGRNEVTQQDVDAAEQRFNEARDQQNVAHDKYIQAMLEVVPDAVRIEYAQARQLLKEAKAEYEESKGDLSMDRNELIKIDEALSKAENRYSEARRKLSDASKIRPEEAGKIEHANAEAEKAGLPTIKEIQDLGKQGKVRQLREAAGRVGRAIIDSNISRAAVLLLAASVFVSCERGADEDSNQPEDVKKELKDAEKEFKENLPPDIAAAAAAEAARLAAAAAGRDEAAEEEGESAEGAPGGEAEEGAAAAETGAAAAGAGGGAEKASEAAGRSPEQKVNGTKNFLQNKTDITLAAVAGALDIKFDGDGKTAPAKIVEAIRDNLQKPLNEALKNTDSFTRLVPDGEIGPRTYAAIIKLKDKSDYTPDKTPLGKLITALRAASEAVPVAAESQASSIKEIARPHAKTFKDFNADIGRLKLAESVDTATAGSILELDEDFGPYPEGTFVVFMSKTDEGFLVKMPDGKKELVHKDLLTDARPFPPALGGAENELPVVKKDLEAARKVAWEAKKESDGNEWGSIESQKAFLDAKQYAFLPKGHYVVELIGKTSGAKITDEDGGDLHIDASDDGRLIALLGKKGNEYLIVDNEGRKGWASKDSLGANFDSRIVTKGIEATSSAMLLQKAKAAAETKTT